ncbi:hypothetical protein VTJ83DRAFT_2616 [Remersonia thermophila]|uniref:P-loop containing nucleoside triphosphate hydrolase protein n=1 Tax=Remersonia thermophila TaxID=72144 RepID=A0ABR4DJE9_9PEZI
MPQRPIFVATHPRACSTAFERVFMTRTDALHCVHEPFGDAFYFGPERLSERYEPDEKARQESGFANTTYADVMDTLLKPTDNEGKRLFIKDIAHYLFPPDGKPASIAPSLEGYGTETKANGANGVNGVKGRAAGANPTVVPLPLLRRFHFAFLIRHPRRAIPSYYRCTIPPLSSRTGFENFMPSEAGYDELRRLFDYLLREGLIRDPRGPAKQGGTAGANGVHGTTDGSGEYEEEAGEEGAVKITVVDADDLLDRPAEVIRAFCQDVGLEYDPGMLKWECPAGQKKAEEAFAKWNGFHDDAIGSTELKARTTAKKIPTEEEEDAEWRQKYGEEGQRIIRASVNANVADYEYLKSFALKV